MKTSLRDLSYSEGSWSSTRPKWFLALAFAVCVAAHAQSGDDAAAIVKKVSTDVLDTVKADKSIQTGDVKRVTKLVDQEVLPYMDFERMTSSAVGPPWREASSAQRQRLEGEFKLPLIRTYSGALAQVQPDQTVEVKPLRAQPSGADVVVQTTIRGSSDPVQLDFHLSKAGGGWKIIDVNVLGVWLVENYRNSFAQEIKTGGLDGLIAKMAEKNGAIASSNR